MTSNIFYSKSGSRKIGACEVSLLQVPKLKGVLATSQKLGIDLSS